MNRFLAVFFLLAGIATSAVSCSPAIKSGWRWYNGAELQISGSFLEIAILMSFACLFGVIGVILYSRLFAGTDRLKDSEAPPAEGNWAMAISASPILMYLGLPLVHLLAPLWLMVRTRGDAALYQHARHTLNFQISWTLFLVVALMLCVVFVGILFVFILLALHFIVTLAAIWRSAKGRKPAYPFQMNFIH